MLYATHVVVYTASNMLSYVSDVSTFSSTQSNPGEPKTAPCPNSARSTLNGAGMYTDLTDWPAPPYKTKLERVVTHLKMERCHRQTRHFELSSIA